MIDTIVVGAGVAGLRTATLLTDAGRDVVVLEARDRIGGRLDSFTVDGASFDLGATWFWPGESRVAAIVEAHGIDVFPQHLAGDALLHTVDGVRRVTGNPIDVPAGRFAGGADAITRVLATRLPSGRLALGTEVTRVRHDGDGVRIESRDRAWRAGTVVIALPPALAVHLIDFEPSLPANIVQLAARTPVWMGGTTKVVAAFERPFWRDAGLAGSAISYVGPLREVHDMSSPAGSPSALFGFAPSIPPASPLATDAVIAQLVELFGPEAANPMHVAIADWSRERFTAPPEAAAMQSYDTYGDPAFAEPLYDGTLHWASTETSNIAPGHIEGALAAAERTARAILEAPAVPRAIVGERK